MVRMADWVLPVSQAVLLISRRGRSNRRERETEYDVCRHEI